MAKGDSLDDWAHIIFKGKKPNLKGTRTDRERIDKSLKEKFEREMRLRINEMKINAFDLISSLRHSQSPEFIFETIRLEDERIEKTIQKWERDNLEDEE